jgi:hypothetical protein
MITGVRDRSFGMCIFYASRGSHNSDKIARRTILSAAINVVERSKFRFVQWRRVADNNDTPANNYTVAASLHSSFFFPTSTQSARADEEKLLCMNTILRKFVT